MLGLTLPRPEAFDGPFEQREALVPVQVGGRAKAKAQLPKTTKEVPDRAERDGAGALEAFRAVAGELSKRRAAQSSAEGRAPRGKTSVSPTSARRDLGLLRHLALICFARPLITLQVQLQGQGGALWILQMGRALAHLEGYIVVQVQGKPEAADADTEALAGDFAHFPGILLYLSRVSEQIRGPEPLQRRTDVVMALMFQPGPI